MPNLNIFFANLATGWYRYKRIIKDYKDYKPGKPLLRGVKTIMHKKTLKIVKRLRRFFIFKESIGRTMRSCMCVVLAKNLFMIQSLLNKMLVYVTRENIHESFSPFVPIVIYIWLKCKYPEVVFALCMESLLSGVSADNEFGRTQLPDAPTQREMELSSLSFSNLSSQPLLSDKKSREKVKQEHFQSLSSWSTASQKKYFLTHKKSAA